MQSLFPKPIWALSAVYFMASLIHFSHNAEFIVFYPNMPNWLTREKVYLAWLAVSGVGVAAVLAARVGWPVIAAIFLAAYGALGLDGLGHYTLALCSEHTLATNLTIWFEVASGLALLLSGALLAKRQILRHNRTSSGAKVFPYWNAFGQRRGSLLGDEPSIRGER